MAGRMVSAKTLWSIILIRGSQHLYQTKAFLNIYPPKPRLRSRNRKVSELLEWSPIVLSGSGCPIG